MDNTIRQKAEKWLQSNIDDQTRGDIERMLNNSDETELVDAFYKDLEFGTGGLRGIMGTGSNRINKYTIGMATQGLANYLKKSFPDKEIKVAIAHDSRNNSDLFAETTATVFSANGIKVYFFDNLRPTPELSFAIRYLKCQSGIVITASHNPKEYNGYKAYWDDGGQLVPPHDKNVIDEVSQITSINEVKFEKNEGLIEIVNKTIDDAYLEHIKKLSLAKEAIRNQSQMKIVFTPIHGTGIVHVPAILEAFGFKNVHVLEAQSTPDGNFPTVVYPNPEEAEAMKLALEKAAEIQADLIMATDPDSDRVGVGIKNPDGEYQLLNGNQTASLLIYYLLKNWEEKNKLNGNQYIVKTIVTTDLIDTIAENYKVNCYNTLTGFKYIAEVIREFEGQKEFIGGGEESYGYLVGDFVRDKDAIISCAMIAEMTAYAKDQGKSLFDYLTEMYMQFGFYREKLISITKKGKSGAEEIEKMMHELRNNPPENINGVKLEKVMDYKVSVEKDLLNGTTAELDFPKSNVLQFFLADGTKISARPSGTEPKIKFYFSVRGELKDAASFKTIEKQLDDRIAGIIDDLQLY